MLYNTKVFALVDCNNFFVSCERVFAPALIGKPVVVLSNNDGCAISRSNEAKALGIKMGEPLFKFKDLVAAHKVTVLSSNFTLYSDMSNRVMQVLTQMTPHIELYSVDEAFLDLSHIPAAALEEYGHHIRSTVYQWLGLPVSVGIASTKTLAKAANYIAKQSTSGVRSFVNKDYDPLLQQLPASQVWGIGRAHRKLLERNSIYTALDLKQVGVPWARRHMAVDGGRLVEELNGNCAYELGNSQDSRKSITVSRSFYDITYQWGDLKAAVSSFVEKACQKLRSYQLVTHGIIVFASSNRFKDDYYGKSHLVHLPVASDYTPDLLAAALQALQHVHKPGIGYKKAGVILVNLNPKQSMQLSLFNQPRTQHHDSLSKSIDDINKRYGSQTLSFGSVNFNNSWRSNGRLCSPNFTCSWHELPRVV